MNTISAQMDAQIRARADKLRSFYHQSDVFKKWLGYHRVRKQKLSFMRSYVENPHGASTSRLRRAYAEADILYGMTPVINDGELISGLPNHDRLTPEELKEYHELERMMKAAPDTGGLTLGHMALDYEKLLRVGISGLLDEVRERRAGLDIVGNAMEDLPKDEFYEGCEIELTALCDLADRYADYAASLAEKETDPVRKEELRTTAENFRVVPRYPAKTFHQALQCIHFYNMSLWELYYFGRVDRYLEPYYTADLKAGRITYEKAVELYTCFMLTPLFAACGDKQLAGTNNSGVSFSGADGEEVLGVPLTADYENYEFNILVCSNGGCGITDDFEASEDTGVVLDIAQYKRTKKVEQDYNISIVSTSMKAGSTNGTGAGFKALSTAANSGDYTYDLAVLGSYEVSNLATNGFLYDMGSVPGIDLTKSWWDQKAQKELQMQGITFFTSGNLSLANNEAAMVILMNKKLLEDYGLDTVSPYDMVKDGTWTFEKFTSLGKQVSEDLNNDGEMDENDRYGLLIWDDSAIGVIGAIGERCCTVDPATGEIGLTLYNERVISALEQYFSLAFDKQHALCYQRIPGMTGSALFGGNHGVFIATYMGLVRSQREMEDDFGILPYPKLDEAQQNYNSLIAPYNSMYTCVPLVQADADRTGVITEALAYHGQKIVLPAYYDVSLVGQSTRDDESSEMLDIIFDNLVFDIGFIFRVGTYNGKILDLLRTYDTNFTSMYETYEPRADMQIREINQGYSAAIALWQKDAQ